MERLTDPAQGYCEMYCKKYGKCFGDPGDCIFEKEKEIYDRLKDIEGIVSFDRLVELAFSDRDGRCVVLPRKPHYRLYSGEEIFIIEDGEIFEDYILEATIGESMNGDGNPCVLYETGEGISFTERDFGKTVFLTREAAEAALKGDCNEN